MLEKSPMAGGLTKKADNMVSIDIVVFFYSLPSGEKSGC
jgi:hypothetical protein